MNERIKGEVSCLKKNVVLAGLALEMEIYGLSSVNWGTAVPIIVAIIGISGVVLPAFPAVFINQVYSKSA